MAVILLEWWRTKLGLAAILETFLEWEAKSKEFFFNETDLMGFLRLEVKDLPADLDKDLLDLIIDRTGDKFYLLDLFEIVFLGLAYLSKYSNRVWKASRASSKSYLSDLALSMILSALSTYLTMSNCIALANLISFDKSSLSSGTFISFTILETKSLVYPISFFSNAFSLYYRSSLGDATEFLVWLVKPKGAIAAREANEETEPSRGPLLILW